MTRFVAAAVQMRSGISVDANVAAAEALIREAAAAGANYVLTPEMTNILDRDRAHLLASVSLEESDPALARFRALAKELGIHLHIGSMAIRLGEEGEDRVANRAFLIAPDGDILARYDKIHMFDVDLAGGESYRESRLYRPGNAAVVADLPWARLGLTDLLRRALSPSLPGARQGGRDGAGGAGRLHPHHRRGALACAYPRAGDRDRLLGDRGGAGRQP